MKKLFFVLGMIALVAISTSCGDDYTEMEESIDQIEITNDPGEGNEGGSGEGSGGPGGSGE